MEPDFLFHPPPPVQDRALRVNYTNGHLQTAQLDLLDQTHLSYSHVNPWSARRRHLRRCFDLMHLLILRGDVVRASRALGVLMQTHEFKYAHLWRFAVLLVGRTAGQQDRDPSQARVSYLRDVALRHPSLRLPVLLELIPELILAKQYHQALEELDLVIHVYPFRNEPTLHLYLGMLTLHSAADAALQRARRDQEIGARFPIHPEFYTASDRHDYSAPPTEFHALPVGLDSLDASTVQAAIGHFQLAIQVTRFSAEDRRRTLRSRVKAKYRRLEKRAEVLRRVRARKLAIRVDVESDAEQDMQNQDSLQEQETQPQPQPPSSQVSEYDELESHASATSGSEWLSGGESGWTDTDVSQLDDTELDEPEIIERKRRRQLRDHKLSQRADADLEQEEDQIQEPWATTMARTFLDMLRPKQSHPRSQPPSARATPSSPPQPEARRPRKKRKRERL